MSHHKYTAKDVTSARETFARYDLKPGDTVYTVLRHVSASGMQRAIDLYIIRDNMPLRLTWLVAVVLDMTYSRKREGLVVNGCGMDMGWHVVYELSYALFGTARDGQLRHEWI